MKILITGICGFAGSQIARRLAETISGLELYGLDNLSRPGSELNRRELSGQGVKIFHADLRVASDLDALPEVDWVIDAAANPSVLAGVDGRSSSRQLVEHNCIGTINLLEFCKRSSAGLILLSTSRVYSIPPLAGLQMQVQGDAYQPLPDQDFPQGISAQGVSENYTTQAPVSLYGATKLASEALALEYGFTFGFPVWVNRCGVLAGAGQFGRADQGIFAYWIHRWFEQRSLRYIGFDGAGHQVRDCLHPVDLADLLNLQMQAGADPSKPALINVSGGLESATSLAQLSAWCTERFGQQTVASEAAERPFDLPWVVLDSGLAKQHWDWAPKMNREIIFNEIAAFAEAHPDWMALSAAY